MSDAALRALVDALIADDSASWLAQLAAAPELVRAAFTTGATRNSTHGYFLDPIQRWLYAGDTALHIAAAAWRIDAARMLLKAGADICARNRHGQTPLHYAANGGPGSPRWNPEAQAATISGLIDAGADPNAPDRRGVAPLHIAIRTRCAEAVRVLLTHGADPARRNGSGSTPILLATRDTGRGGSGSPAARAQQREILEMLKEALGQAR